MSYILSVNLTPKASSNRIGTSRILSNDKEQLKIYVTAPPDKNKANDAMLELLAEHLGVAKSSLTIIQGQTSRNKLIEVNV